MRGGSHMQVCRRGQVSIVLLLGFHSVHLSVRLGLSLTWQHQMAERERNENAVEVLEKLDSVKAQEGWRKQQEEEE